MTKTYFYIRQEGRRNVTHGTHSCVLGDKLNAPLIDGRPQGSYAEWSWDAERLVAKNDHCGFYPLFYYWDGSEFCIAPSITALLEFAKDRTLDYPALSVFLRLGFFIGNDTPFKHIKVLPPKASLIWKNGQLTVEGSYTIPEAISDNAETAKKRLTALFREGLKRRLPEGAPFALTLSGGCDSRHILFELVQMGHRPMFCITTRKYPPSTDDDLQVAKKITAELDIKHVVIENRFTRFANELRNFDRTHFCADEHAWILETAEYLKNKISILYDGIGGGTLLMSDHREEECASLIREGHLEEAAIKILSHWYKRDEKTFQLMLGHNFYKQVSYERAKAHLVEELKKHAKAANPFVSFSFWNRSRREIGLSPYGVFNGVQKVHCPFLDYNFAQYALSLPASVLQDKVLRREFVQQANPQFAHIPFDNDDIKDAHTNVHRGQFLIDLTWYLLQGNFIQSRYLKMNYLLPRMFKCLMSREYAQTLWWIHPQIILYLLELEKMQRRITYKTVRPLVGVKGSPS